MDPIPLEEQLRRYEDNWRREVGRLQRRLKDPAYLLYIHDMGWQRLVENYPIYGDAMYHWGSACREQNQDQELSDYIVYGSSES
jgi:hypothetical protein